VTLSEHLRVTVLWLADPVPDHYDLLTLQSSTDYHGGGQCDSDVGGSHDTRAFFDTSDTARTLDCACSAAARLLPRCPSVCHVFRSAAILVSGGVTGGKPSMTSNVSLPAAVTESFSAIFLKKNLTNSFPAADFL